MDLAALQKILSALSGARIVCVGDSMPFGWGVDREDTYPGLLAKALAARYPDRTIEVLNLGVPGLTVVQIAELTRRDILSFEPDIAIVAFGMNDYRVGRWGKTTLATIENVRRLDPDWMRRYDWLLESSDLARFLATRRTRDTQRGTAERMSVTSAATRAARTVRAVLPRAHPRRRCTGR